MNTGLHFFSKLSPTEQEKFKSNCEDDMFSEIMENKYTTFYNFITDVFMWSGTSQDYDYWNDVSEREL